MLETKYFKFKVVLVDNWVGLRLVSIRKPQIAFVYPLFIPKTKHEKPNFIATYNLFLLLLTFQSKN